MNSSKRRKRLEVFKVEKPEDFCSFHGRECPHPLVAVIDFNKQPLTRHVVNQFNIYALFLFAHLPDTKLVLGAHHLQGDGQMFAVAPGQLAGKVDEGVYRPLRGWSLLFHPDLLHGSELGKFIKVYRMFGYAGNTMLKLDPTEYEFYTSLLKRILAETKEPRTSRSDTIIRGCIRLLLDCTQKNFDQQFPSDQLEPMSVSYKIDELVKQFYRNHDEQSLGIPTVAIMASRLGLSANYLNELVKKETGYTTQAVIQYLMIAMSKEMLLSGRSVSQTAYALGFEYPQHFSRLFKAKMGISPTDFQVQNGLDKLREQASE